MDNEGHVYRAVSLFTNCGAGDLGFKQAGFRFDVMAELDSRRLEVAILNHEGAEPVPGDLRDTWGDVITKYRAIAGDMTPTLLAACPPCQGMSSANGTAGTQEDAEAGSRDARNLLVVVIAEVAQELQPDFIVVENVQAFFTKKVLHPETGLPISAANLLISQLDESYHVFPILTDLCDFGIPQTRKRAFLTFVKRDLPILQTLLAENLTPYPIPEYATDHGGNGPRNVQHTLESFELPELDADCEENARSEVGNGLHVVPVWSEAQYKMIAAIPAHSGASAWQNNTCPGCEEIETNENAAVCSNCGVTLLRPVILENGEFRLIKGFKTSTYKRMDSGQPAATITTASGHVGSHTTIHPYENRVLSSLECALLQTFPLDFAWGTALEQWGHTNIRKMIGEAVPPAFTELHGQVLQKLISNETPTNLLPRQDKRIKKALKKLGLDQPIQPVLI